MSVPRSPPRIKCPRVRRATKVPQKATSTPHAFEAIIGGMGESTGDALPRVLSVLEQLTEEELFTTSGGELVRGVVARHNRKSVTVVTPDGHQWRVSPSLLRAE